MNTWTKSGSALMFLGMISPAHADDRDQLRTCLGMVNMAQVAQQSEQENLLQLFEAVRASDLDQVDGCLRRFGMPDEPRTFLMMNVRKMGRDLQVACNNPSRASGVAAEIAQAYPVRICPSRGE